MTSAGGTVRARSTVQVLADADAVAEAVARQFADAAAAAARDHGRFAVALAGGSTPKASYTLLARPPYRDVVPWDRVLFFFGDERCVPPDNPDSNYGMARATLLTPLGIDASRVFRMRGEDAPDAAAASYADVLVRQLGADPVLDLIMLGLGPEGHTASLFPGTVPPPEDPALVAAPFIPKLAAHRITLTPRALNAATDVVVATVGTAKADALAHVLDGPYEPNVYPAQILHPRSGRLTWIVDRAAAEETS